jgi:hypothetical protein
MKPEPQLIDLFAMFALMNQTNDSSHGCADDENKRAIYWRQR